MPNYKELVEQLSKLLEDRKKKILYSDDKDKITAIIPNRGFKVEKQAIEQIAELTEQKRLIEEQLKLLTKETKPLVENLFNALDGLKTRVVRTQNAILTISKASTTEKVDYEKAIELLKTMVPDLKNTIDEALKQSSKITKKSPSYTFGKVQEGILDTIKTFIKKITNWFTSYDTKLQQVEALLA